MSTKGKAGLKPPLRVTGPKRQAIEAELRKSEARLKLLVEAGRRLGATLDIQKLYGSFRELVSHAMPCEGFLVSAYDRQTNLITCEYAWVDGNLIDVATLPPLELAEEGTGMQSKVIRNGEPLFFGNVPEVVSQPGGEYYEVTGEGEVSEIQKAKPPSTQCMLMAPIKLEGRVIGVVQVSSDSAGAYTQEHLEILEGLVLQTAFAAQNARLYQRAQQEIGEREKLESAMRATEQRLRRTLDGMANIAWSVAEDGSVDYVNQRLIEYAGASDPDEVKGEKGWASVVHPDDMAESHRLYDQAMKNGSVWESETRLRRYDGAYRWHLSRMVPVEERDGRPTRWFGTSTDIHDLMTATSALEAVLKNTPDALFRVDRQMRFIFLNSECERVLKVSADRCLGKTAVEAGVGPEFEMLIEEGGRSAMEARADHLEVSSNERHYLCRAVPETGQGGVESVLFICTDITERKQVEQLLRGINDELERRVELRTAELRTVITEMEGFTYLVSHDLRAPLRAISSTSNILLDEAADSLDTRWRDLLRSQAKAASKLGTLIDELLRLSRVSRSEMVLNKIDLSALAEGVAQELIGREWVVPPSITVQPGLSLVADDRLMKLVLLNLLENAIKFSPDGAVVSVGSAGGNAFFVRDEGVGFDMKYEEKLWMPFERLVRDDEFPGTGIGLANVKRIVERHGGRVWAESAPGEGSTFYFAL